VLLEHASPARHGPYVPVQALNAIDALGAKAAGLHAELRKLPREAPGASPRVTGYVPRLIEHILERK
jgi:hypothetical protein